MLAVNGARLSAFRKQSKNDELEDLKSPFPEKIDKNYSVMFNKTYSIIFLISTRSAHLE